MSQVVSHPPRIVPRSIYLIVIGIAAIVASLLLLAIVRMVAPPYVKDAPAWAFTFYLAALAGWFALSMPNPFLGYGIVTFFGFVEAIFWWPALSHVDLNVCGPLVFAALMAIAVVASLASLLSPKSVWRKYVQIA